MPAIIETCQSVAKKLRFFDFSRWWLPPSWIFEFVKFLLADGISKAHMYHLARSAKLPTGLCILTSVISFFLFSSFLMISPRQISQDPQD